MYLSCLFSHLFFFFSFFCDEICIRSREVPILLFRLELGGSLFFLIVAVICIFFFFLFFLSCSVAFAPSLFIITYHINDVDPIV